MKYTLEPLSISLLSTMSVGQLIQRHLDDIAKILPAPTDVPLKAYIAKLTEKSQAYEKSIVVARKDEITTKVEAADADRDKALGNMGKALKLYKTSELAAEAEAAAGLLPVFNSYKNLANWTYEDETKGIDKLLADFASATNAKRVATLGIQRYIDRLKSTNATFKALTSGRTSAQVTSPHANTRQLRRELSETYNEMTSYIVALANATDKAEFATTLAYINTQRKYFADTLARQVGMKAPGDTTTSQPPLGAN